MNAAASHDPGPQHQTLSQCPQPGGKLPGPRSARPGHRVGPEVVAVWFFVLDYELALGVIPSSLRDASYLSTQLARDCIQGPKSLKSAVAKLLR